MSGVTAVVPARGGSRGVPRKNLVDLGGRPLLWWTLETARRSGVVTRLIVSSDDEEILESAVACGVEAETHRRPTELGHHDVHAVHVVLEVLEVLTDDQLPDVVMMLLPTSPFRRPEDVATAVRLLAEAEPPAVISVTELDKQLIHLRTFEENELVPFLPWEQLTAQRQDQPPLYGLNGSVYAARPEVLRQHGTFHVPGAHGFVMPRTASVDINDPVDLVVARALLEQGMVA